MENALLSEANIEATLRATLPAGYYLDPALFGDKNHTVLYNLEEGTWLELAVATHDGHCDTCVTQPTGPLWDNVEDGLLVGSYGDGQCGGCGTLGSGWVETGARDLADIDDPDALDIVLADMVKDLLAAQAKALGTATEKAQRELREHLEWIVGHLRGDEPLEDLLDSIAGFTANIDGYGHNDVSYPVAWLEGDQLRGWIGDPRDYTGDGFFDSVPSPRGAVTEDEPDAER